MITDVGIYSFGSASDNVVCSIITLLMVAAAPFTVFRAAGLNERVSEMLSQADKIDTGSLHSTYEL